MGKNDGLHMYTQVGALAFTTSLVNILKAASLEKGRGRRSASPHSTTPSAGGWQQVHKGQNQSRNQQEATSFQIPTSNRYQGFC